MKHIIALTLIALTGCMSTGTKIDRAGADRIKVGDSKQDVLAAIGKPNGVGRDAASGQETWTYIYTLSTVRPATFIPYAGAFVGGADNKTDTVIVSFAPDGTVANVNTSFADIEAATNLATAAGDRKAEPKPAPTGKPARQTK